MIDEIEPFGAKSYFLAANSGSSDTVRLQQWQKYRRTQIVPSNAISTSVRV
jgi:hypothetical protein